MRGVGRRLGRLRVVAGRVAPRADAQLALQNLHRVELERQSRLQARLRGVRRGLEVARVQQGGGQCLNLTGITSPDNQTRSWITSQNNQKVVLTGIQYHFGPEPETGPDRPSRALEASDRHLYTPKQPFNFKYISFLAVSDLLRLLRDVSRPYSYFSRVLDQSDAGGHG